ncbi:hypothetical protein [Sorangium sp. So ce131]|uniref:hypothetical protein n=1 Tax=Sorangium sp. So ce131 TaxID=3133282 RepID=UPI003F63CBD9
MSTAHHDPRAAAAHDADDHHAFDGEPAHALPADEPPTPSWVPALGLALFVVAGVAFLATSSDGAPEGRTAPAAARPAAAADAQPATPRPAAAEAQRGAPGGAAAAPAASGSANLRKLTPEEVDRMRKRMMEARQKEGVAKPSAPAPPK